MITAGGSRRSSPKAQEEMPGWLWTPKPLNTSWRALAHSDCSLCLHPRPDFCLWVCLSIPPPPLGVFHIQSAGRGRFVLELSFHCLCNLPPESRGFQPPGFFSSSSFSLRSEKFTVCGISGSLIVANCFSSCLRNVKHFHVPQVSLDTVSHISTEGRGEFRFH